MTEPAGSQIINQEETLEDVISQVIQRKRRIYQHRWSIQNVNAAKLKSELPSHLSRAMELASEKGASSWLTALPLVKYGFVLHKGAFRDALCLRYGWQPQHLPSHCSCGQLFSVSHALMCPTGGYPTLRHNEIRDLTADLLREVCHDVTVEHHLQQMTGEVTRGRTSVVGDEARLDVSACGMWGGRFERTENVKSV